jgi:Calcium-dependent channel, 7TM region, putative phosphate
MQTQISIMDNGNCLIISFVLQIINVYNQEYESSAAFWPFVQSRIIIGLLISQVLLIGLLSTKKAANSTPLLALLPVFTIWFHYYCKKRFEPAFRKYPLEVRFLLFLIFFICAHNIY